MAQTRQLYLTEKMTIKYKRVKTNYIFQNSLDVQTQNFLRAKVDSWKNLTKSKDYLVNNLKLRNLQIYAYSISRNLIKEVITKIGSNLSLTSDIKKASLIIGLKRHIRQNSKLNKISKQYQIPIYIVNQTSVYQIFKIIQIIN